MNQPQHLLIADAAQRDTQKIADADVDRHPHAINGTAQNVAFAVKFDLPHATVCTAVVRIEANRQRESVEPQWGARPGGVDPACSCLTPHGLVSPPELWPRSMRRTLPEPRPKS